MKPARPQGPHIPIGGSYEKKTNKIILVEGRALSACSSSFQKGKAFFPNQRRLFRLGKSAFPEFKADFPWKSYSIEETDS